MTSILGDELFTAYVSRRKNGYITVKENKTKKTIGTKITVKLKQSTLDSIMKRNKYSRDFLDDNFEMNQTFDSLKRYVREFLLNINTLKINFSINKISLNVNYRNRMLYSNTNLDKFIKISEKTNITYEIYFDKDLRLMSYIKDYDLGILITITPKINLVMVDDYDLYFSLKGYLSSYDNALYYKEISVKNNALETIFLCLNINLLKGKAKDVLNVSRENLDDSLKMKLHSRINDVIIPEFLNYTGEFLNRKDTLDIISKENKNVTLRSSLIVYDLASYSYLNINTSKSNFFNIDIPNTGFSKNR